MPLMWEPSKSSTQAIDSWIFSLACMSFIAPAIKNVAARTICSIQMNAFTLLLSQ